MVVDEKQARAADSRAAETRDSLRHIPSAETLFVQSDFFWRVASRPKTLCHLLEKREKKKFVSGGSRMSHFGDGKATRGYQRPGFRLLSTGSQTIFQPNSSLPSSPQISANLIPNFFS